MSALEAFRQAQAALGLAIDGDDAEAMDVAMRNFRSAIFVVRGAGLWQQHPQMGRIAATMIGKFETSRRRVGNLTPPCVEKLTTLDILRQRSGLTDCIKREILSR